MIRYSGSGIRDLDGNQTSRSNHWAKSLGTRLTQMAERRLRSAVSGFTQKSYLYLNRLTPWVALVPSVPHGPSYYQWNGRWPRKPGRRRKKSKNTFKRRKELRKEKRGDTERDWGLANPFVLLQSPLTKKHRQKRKTVVVRETVMTSSTARSRWEQMPGLCTGPSLPGLQTFSILWTEMRPRGWRKKFITWTKRCLELNKLLKN